MAYIGLDVGHGTDTWETGGGKGVVKLGKVYEEHDFNSKLAKEIKAKLEAQGHTVTFGAQQPNAKDVALTTRTNKFNALGVDFVISIHANAGVADADGRCVFYWHDHTDSKKLAEKIVKSIEGKGYTTHGNGLHASMTGSWTNLHMVRETKMTAILIEYGFMTSNKDFEYIFGSKQNQYVKDMAEATVKGVQAYLGKSFTSGATTTSKPDTSETTNIDKLVQEVLDGKHGAGDERKRSLGSQYNAVQAEVNRLLGVGSKSVDTLAKEVIDGKWGNGSDRRNRLTAAGYNYNAIQSRVNQLL